MSKIKWDIIPPEIKYDDFYTSIISLIMNSTDINNILEIGASSGDGSTEAFQIGKKGKSISLYSIEVCTERFNLLKNRYIRDPNFYPYNVSSVGVNEFPEKKHVIDFHKNVKTNLSNTPIETVLQWYDTDIAYITQNNIPQNGVELIKKEHNIDFFDCVLIDGSEFTGMAEYEHIKGAKYILLDDINAYKTFNVNQLLKNDPNYVCLVENYNVRGGFSIYTKV